MNGSKCLNCLDRRLIDLAEAVLDVLELLQLFPWPKRLVLGPKIGRFGGTGGANRRRAGEEEPHENGNDWQ